MILDGSNQWLRKGDELWIPTKKQLKCIKMEWKIRNHLQDTGKDPGRFIYRIHTWCCGSLPYHRRK